MTEIGGLLFGWHEVVGLCALAILLVTWFYRVVKWKRESHGRLFPWVAREGLSKLRQEILAFLTLRWTKLPDDGALAGTIHGLGLLIITAMAVTGGLIYLMLGPQNELTTKAKTLMDVHSFLATFAWIYFCGHVTMAFWHEYVGHKTLSRMFRLTTD